MSLLNTGAENETPAAAPPRILIVDDEDNVFDVFQHLLPAAEYAMTLASNGRQALELAGAREFDLAFVDYFLAELNGAEIAQQMHALRPAMKIVLMSCYSEHENRDALLEMAGASEWVTKPLTGANTLAVVERLLGGNGTAGRV
jgi:CheY-like chemotaxis protein